jgi:hypothetical protein
MPDAISLSITQLPTRYHGHPAIESRLWRRSEADEQEVVFRFRGQPQPALLPIIYNEEFRIVRWGNGQRKSKLLPAIGTVHGNDLKKPTWQQLQPIPVIIEAQALLHRNVWISVVGGIHGICVHDEHGTPSVYVVTEKSTDYYQIMTKSWVMPRLVEEVI